MTPEQQKRRDFFAELHALLVKYNADIDLRDDGGPYECYYRIDLNVDGHTDHMNDTIDTFDLEQLIQDLER